jgi:biopolymer transport protein TolR
VPRITTPPALHRADGGRPVRREKTLNLAVLVVTDGFAVRASGGSMAPGCKDVGPGLAVPRNAAGYHLDGLAACAERLKAARPEFAEETQ